MVLGLPLLMGNLIGGQQQARQHLLLDPVNRGLEETLPTGVLAGFPMVDIKVTHIPFKGAAPAIVALMGGTLTLQKASDDQYFKDLANRVSSTSLVNLPRAWIACARARSRSTNQAWTI